MTETTLRGRITDLSSKEISTKRGPALRWSCKVDGRWVSGFNEIPQAIVSCFEEKTSVLGVIVTPREHEGRTFYNYKALEE